MKGELFAVKDEMVGYTYEIASINELDWNEEWAKFVIVKEGSFKWDYAKDDYISGSRSQSNIEDHTFRVRTSSHLRQLRITSSRENFS